MTPPGLASARRLPSGVEERGLLRAAALASLSATRLAEQAHLELAAPLARSTPTLPPPHLAAKASSEMSVSPPIEPYVYAAEPRRFLFKEVEGVQGGGCHADVLLPAEGEKPAAGWPVGACPPPAFRRSVLLVWPRGPPKTDGRCCCPRRKPS